MKRIPTLVIILSLAAVLCLPSWSFGRRGGDSHESGGHHHAS